MPSLVDLGRRIADGSLSAAHALDLSRKAIAQRDGAIGAFLRLAEPGPPGQGPLAGIAVGVKDNIDTADMATEIGSPIYAGWRPRADAAVVSALRRAGATILGKTTTTPFATMDPTATRNPHDPGHTPGGSSAGSAAAVGAGLVPLALGSQTAGSVIRPASFCGAAAMKPSFRLIPTVGVKTLAWTLDTVGLFAAGARDLALALEIVSGRPMARPPLDRPRFGLCRQRFAGDAEPDGEAALEAAAAALSRAGATIVELDAPATVADGLAAQPIVQDHEAAAALAWEHDHRRDLLPPKLLASLDTGRAIGAAAYDEARGVANRARRDAPAMFAGLDAIVTYAAPGPAPRGLEATGDPRFNRLWTLLGTPCLSVPGLAAPSGLPIGIQVVAPFGRDAEALAAAVFLERALSDRA